MNLTKNVEENEQQYIWRICNAKDNGIIDLDWKSLSKVFNKETNKNYDESAFRKSYQSAKLFYDKVFSNFSDCEVKNSIRELKKERIKLQTEKIEYNQMLREQARDELFEEKVIKSIKESGIKLVIPKKINYNKSNKGAQLNIADSHFGKEYKIYGLFDEIINEYSPEIYYERMEFLYNKVLDIIEKENIKELHINNLGDHIEGFIRNSQLWSLRYGVVDSAVYYGNYLGSWLNKISHSVKVIYNQTDGNHDELRLLDGKKGEHLCESVGKIVINCIKLLNDKNPNLEIRENKTGFIFDNIVGFNFLGIHGEVKDLNQAIKDYENIYNTRIDYLIAGHKHYNEYCNCGVRKGTIGVASIVGSDDFSMKIRKSSDASANLIIYEEKIGKIIDYTIVLN